MITIVSLIVPASRCGTCYWAVLWLTGTANPDCADSTLDLLSRHHWSKSPKQDQLMTMQTVKEKQRHFVCFSIYSCHWLKSESYQGAWRAWGGPATVSKEVGRRGYVVLWRWWGWRDQACHGGNKQSGAYPEYTVLCFYRSTGEGKELLRRGANLPWQKCGRLRGWEFDDTKFCLFIYMTKMNSGCYYYWGQRGAFNSKTNQATYWVLDYL